jgi:hypothetical protein
METVYEWLLHNTEDEGNYFTILNTKRHTEGQGSPYLDVMVRTKDFTVVNLNIYPKQSTDSPNLNTGRLQGRDVIQHLEFAGEQEVISYLCTGEASNPTTDSAGVVVDVLQPVGASGSITFPPEQNT